jgi:hypothetical protein
MAVDVVYEGIVLARGSQVQETPAGLFVALEAPMPVGTPLSLDEAGAKRTVRVARVHEGVGPGVIVVARDGSQLPKADTVVTAAQVPPPSAEPAPPPAEPAPAPAPVAATTDPEPARFRDTMDDLPPPRPKEEPAPTPPPPTAAAGGADETRATIVMQAFTPEQLEAMAAEAAQAEAAKARAAEAEPRDDRPTGPMATIPDGGDTDGNGNDRRGGRKRRKTRPPR